MRVFNVMICLLSFIIISGCQQASRESAREKDREARGDLYEEARTETNRSKQQDQPNQQQQLQQQQQQQQQFQDMGSPEQVNVSEKIDGKVWHYVCSKRCKGGVSDSPKECPACGQMMAHNQAFHEQDGGQQGGFQQQQIEEQFQQQQQQQQIQRQAEPAQNEQGVWHYICPQGCSGGDGSPTACKSCGSTLIHNDAYHR